MKQGLHHLKTGPWIAASALIHMALFGLFLQQEKHPSPETSAADSLPLQITLIRPALTHSALETPAIQSAHQAAPLHQHTLKKTPHAFVPYKDNQRIHHEPPTIINKEEPMSTDAVETAKYATAPTPLISIPIKQEEHASAQPFNKPTDQTFIDLLYTAIDSKKQYPYSANKRRQEGTTTLFFKMKPDGNIEAIQTKHSSRSKALDMAAIKAVQQITPFLPASRFLTAPTEFEIDIIFQL